MLTFVGLLVSVAMPAYQRARNSALIGSMVDQLMGYAKACASINASGVGERPVPPDLSEVRGGVSIHEGCNAQGQGAMLEASWGAARAEGIDCQGSRSLISSSRATLVIDEDNTMHCSFED